MNFLTTFRLQFVLHHFLSHPTQIQLRQYKFRGTPCSCTALIDLLCFSISPSNIRHFAWFQASTAKCMITALFWATMQRAVVIPYRRFGTINQSYLHGSRIHLGPCIKDGFVVLKRRYGITTTCSVIVQNRAVLIRHFVFKHLVSTDYFINQL